MICLKYRILPTRAQETALLATLAVCREVYNSLITERTAVYETKGESLTYRHQQNVSLKDWKAVHPELSEIHSQVLQNVAVRVDLS
jgi:putative transposase